MEKVRLPLIPRSCVECRRKESCFDIRVCSFMYDEEFLKRLRKRRSRK
jgi:hypothetical protein